MASSSKKLESKDPIDEVIPTSLIKIVPVDVAGIIYDYALDANPEWIKNPPTFYTFFGIPSSQKQILALVEHAGPLDLVEAYIRKAHARGESHLPTTLRKAINQAIIGLDQAMIYDKKRETLRFFEEDAGRVEKGMAEKLLELYAELYPATYNEALEQAELAAPPEDKKEKEAREKANFAAITQVFEAFKKNDGHIDAAIEEFKAFVRSTKPEVISTNRYYLNLLHLVFVAFQIISERDKELPPIEGDFQGVEYRGCYGKLADRFCLQIIGAAIEREFPARVWQVVGSGRLTGLPTIKEIRDLNINDKDFAAIGIHIYYDDWGRLIPWQWQSSGRVRGETPYFGKYYEQLCHGIPHLKPRNDGPKI